MKYLFILFVFLGFSAFSQECSPGFNSKNNACVRFMFPSIPMTPDTAIQVNGTIIDTFIIAVTRCTSGQNAGYAIYGEQGGSCSCSGAYNQNEAGTVTFIMDDGTRFTCIYTNGTLPVSWLAFEGERAPGGVMIKWKTASENNNDYFQIERSTDAVLFETIGKVAGAGSSNTIISYDFLDGNPKKGINYYRITQYDYDGQAYPSEIIAFENVDESQTEILAYNRILKVFTKQKVQKLQLFAFDGTLKKQFETGNQQREFSLSDLAIGNYVVRLTTDSEVISQKIQVR